MRLFAVLCIAAASALSCGGETSPSSRPNATAVAAGPATSQPEPATTSTKPVVGPAESAEQLVARVLDARRTAGFQVRATLTHTKDGQGTVRQLVMKALRERDQVTTLYELVKPADVAGRTLVIRAAGQRQPSGFLYQSGKVTRLTPATLAQPFFDSDLRIDDLAEVFWFWPSPRTVGVEEIGEYRCAIVEFRPKAASAAPTPYSLVKAWVSPDLLVALRIEQFGLDERLVKRIDLYRVLKIDQRWWPTLLTVEPAHGRSRTVIEGTEMKSKLRLSDADFTIGEIRKPGRARD